MTIKDLNYWKQRVNKITSFFTVIEPVLERDNIIDLIREFDESLLEIVDSDKPLKKNNAFYICDALSEEMDELVEQVDGTEDSSIIRALIQSLEPGIKAQEIIAALLKFPPLDYAKVFVYEFVSLIDSDSQMLGDILVCICAIDKLTEAVNQCWNLLPKHDLEKIAKFIHEQENIPNGFLEGFPGVLKVNS